MDVKFHIGVLCSCGWALEEDRDAVEYLGTVTVKPCPICCGQRKRPEREDTAKQYNRRGTLVDERST